MKIRLTLLTLLCCGLQAFAQNPVVESKGVHPELTLRVLDSVEVQLGDRSIFYERVAPPAVPAAREAGATPRPPAPVATQLHGSPRPAKLSRTLFLSAAVNDRGFTELQSWSPQGELRAVSNVDFRLLAGITEIETADTVWLLFLSVVHAPRKAEAQNAKAPRAQTLSPTRAQYTLVAAPSPPDHATLSALDSIHTFFDANRSRLIAEHAQREAARAAAAQSPAEAPAVPQDTVIHYWPQKSRIYPTTAR